MQTISEEYLLGVLLETLHPTQSSTFLSGSFYEELENAKGYLETLMVTEFFIPCNYCRKLYIIQIIRQQFVNWQL